MGFLQYHRGTKSEISPYDHQTSDSSDSNSNSNSISSQPSLASVASLTSQQLTVATNHEHVATFKAHTSSVSAIVLVGKHVLSGSSDSQIRTWPRDSRPTAQNLLAYGGSAVKAMAVCGDKIFVGHQDRKICVWKIDTNGNHNDNHMSRKRIKSTRITTLPTLNDRFTKLFSPKHYVTVRRHKRSTWVHHHDAISSLAVSTDGSLVYSASWDRTFKVWRSTDFKCLESVPNAHDDAINAIVVSADGRVFTGSADRTIKVWRRHNDDKTHSLVETLHKHRSAVNALALSPDGRQLYSGACDRSIIVWDTAEDGGDGDRRGTVVAGALRGHGKAVLCIATVGDVVVSGSADRTVRVWRRGIDGRSYERVCVLEGHNGPIKCLGVALDGCTLADSGGTSYLVYSGSLDCDVNVWKIWVPFL